MALGLITVAGTVLPDPSEYVGTTIDMVNSGRNAAGVVVADVIRSDTAKIEATWSYISAEQWAAILTLFKSNFANSVRFFDQTTNDFATRTMYIGDRTTGGLVTSGGAIKGWKNAKLTLIEV